MAAKDKKGAKAKPAPAAKQPKAAAKPKPKPGPASAVPAAPSPRPEPVAAPPAPAPAPDRGRASLGLSRLTSALGGASLCYGEPIEVGERVVVPIARVRGMGGYGFGRGAMGADGQGDGDGGGGGGAVEASPAGFLDITPDGVRYEAIPDPLTTARAISTAASGIAMIVGAAAGLRRLQRRRRGLLPPG